MQKTAAYVFLETLRASGQAMGALARAAATDPRKGGARASNPWLELTAAWGEVTEHAFAAMATKPRWNLRTVTGADGTDSSVEQTCVAEKAFCNLVRFSISRPSNPAPAPIFLIAPLSGHYATLLRATIASLLPYRDVFVTDWKNARDVPLSEGAFDVEGFVHYLLDFWDATGTDTHVVAVCQPAPLALVGAAKQAQRGVSSIRSLTLVGGPIDPDAPKGEVGEFAAQASLADLEKHAIQTVGPGHAGRGRDVYPGALQLAAFMSMNAGDHFQAFADQVLRTAKGETDGGRHDRFYDEYLSVMDMPAEFYLSTVHRIFKEREVARNAFFLDGDHIDLSLIQDLPILTVEGGGDDIAPPGQCRAALDLLTGVSDDLKHAHVEPDVGHYGIFSGSKWETRIRPVVLDFLDRFDD